MGHRDNGGVVKSQGDSGNGLDTGQEAVNEFLLVNVKDIRREDVALVEDLDNSHTVGERRDVEHVEEGGLRASDTGSGSDDLDIGHNFNSTTGNLGGNTEGLEERGLSGFHSSVAGRDGDILGREGTCTGRGSDLVGHDDFTDILEVVRGEDESNVTLDERQQALVLGVLGKDGAESTADHGVLTHQHDTLSTEGDTDLMHLVGTNIVDVHQEDGGWMLCIKKIEVYMLL